MCLCTLGHTVIFRIIFISIFLHFHPYNKQCNIYCAVIFAVLCPLMGIWYNDKEERQFQS